MSLRVWGAALMTLGLAATAVADDDLSLNVVDRNLVLDMAKGDKPVKGSADADRAIDAVSKFLVQRLASRVNRGLAPGRIEPMSTLVNDSTRYVLDLSSSKQLVDSQKDFIAAFGKAMVTQMKPLLGTKDKPSQFEPLVRMNAARMLSVVAKSGSPDAVDLALTILENPKESNAVKLYAFQTLKHAFAAINSEDPTRSFITGDREKKAVAALIDFIEKKVEFSATTPPEELEGFRYVRREAIRALGSVRKPALKEGGILGQQPALTLLKVAAMDVNIIPLPSLSERAEAVVGYMQLLPDRSQNADYALYFIGLTIYDLGMQYKAYQSKPKVNIDPKTPVSGDRPEPYEILPWKVTAARLGGAMKEWKDAWVLEHPSPPQPQGKMVLEFTTLAQEAVLNQIAATSGQPDVRASAIEEWFKTNQFPSKSLFRDDPKAIITLPNRGG